MKNRAGLVRAAVVALVAGAVVAGASGSSGTVRLAAPHERAGVPQGSDVLVEEAVLLCPGQGQQGSEGLRDVPGAVRAAVAAPPGEVLQVDASAGRGSLTLRSTPAGRSLVSAADRGRIVSAVVPVTATADAVSVAATGPLAPGVVAAQTWLRTGDDDRGLALTPCTRPSAELWLLGGSAGPSRTERLVLTNPGANAVSVRVEVFGAKGPVEGLEDRAVSIAPGARTVVSVDALAPGESSPAVHVIASGGVVAGVLVDSWIDGATGRGTDTVTPSATPDTELVVPGVDVDGAAVLRLANPGPTEALAQVRLLTPAGDNQPETLRAVRVPARSTVDVPLTTPVKGMGGLRVVADHPVTAGVFVERRATSGDDRMGDFGWAPAMPAITGLGGVALPDVDGPVTAAALVLGAGGEQTTASVSILTGGTVSRRSVTLQPESSTTIALGEAGAVWVEPRSGELFAAVTLAASDAQGPLYSVAGVYATPLTALSVPVRQVGR